MLNSSERHCFVFESNSVDETSIETKLVEVQFDGSPERIRLLEGRQLTLSRITEASLVRDKETKCISGIEETDKLEGQLCICDLEYSSDVSDLLPLLESCKCLGVVVSCDLKGGSLFPTGLVEANDLTTIMQECSYATATLRTEHCPDITTDTPITQIAEAPLTLIVERDGLESVYDLKPRSPPLSYANLGRENRVACRTLDLFSVKRGNQRGNRIESINGDFYGKALICTTFVMPHDLTTIARLGLDRGSVALIVSSQVANTSLFPLPSFSIPHDVISKMDDSSCRIFISRGGTTVMIPVEEDLDPLAATDQRRYSDSPQWNDALFDDAIPHQSQVSVEFTARNERTAAVSMIAIRASDAKQILETFLEVRQGAINYLRINSPYPLFVVHATRGRDGRIDSVGGNARGHVCICSEMSRGDIRAIRETLQAQGASALIAQDTGVDGSGDLPLFVLERSLFHRLLNGARHELHTTPVDGEDTSPLSKEQEGSSGFFIGAISAGFSAGKKLLWGNDPIFKSSPKQLDSSEFAKAYIKILKGVEGKYSVAADEAIKLFSGKKWQFYHWAAAGALVLEMENNPNLQKSAESLQHAMFDCIANFHVDSHCIDFLAPGRKIRSVMQPHKATFGFLAPRIRVWARLENPDALPAFNCLFLLANSGLFRMTFNPDIWRSLQEETNVRLLLSSRNKDAILGHLPPEQANCLLIGLSNSLEEGIAVCASLRNSEGPKLPVHNILKKLLQWIVASTLNVNPVQGAWVDLLALQDFLDLSPRDQKEIITSAFDNAVASSDVVDHLCEILQVTPKNHACYGMVKSCAQRCLIRTISVANSSTFRAFELVSGELFLTSGMPRRVLEVVETALKGPVSPENKLKLVGVTLSMYIRRHKWVGTPSINTIEDSLFLSLKDGFQKEPIGARLNAYLLVSVEHPLLFAQDFDARVAGEVLSLSAVRHVLEYPGEVDWSFFTPGPTNLGDGFLVNRVRESVLRCPTSIDVACAFFEKARSLCTNCESVLANLARDVVAHAFQNAPNTSITHLWVSHRSLFYIVLNTKEDSSNEKKMEEFSRCRSDVLHSLRTWFTDLRRCRLTMDDYRSSARVICEIAEFLEENHAGNREIFIEVPGREDINKIEKGFNRAEEMLRIWGDLVEVHAANSPTVSMDYILLEFRCSEDEAIQRIISKFRKNEYERNETVSTLINDFNQLDRFAKTYEAHLSFCAFFVHNSSTLFRSFVARTSAESLSFSALAAKIDQWKDEISSTFSPSAPLAKIRATKDVLVGCDVSAELRVLKECTYLEISSDIVDSFFDALFFLDVSTDFNQFCCFCNKANFQSIHDPSFDMTQSILNKLDEEDGEFTLTECVDAFEDICNYFMTNIEWEKCVCPRERMQSEVLPAICLLSALWQCFDLWVYVEDSEWNGERGLKRFYQQYENMTQLLMNSNSYEMATLDAMAECVRLISSCSSLSGCDSLDVLVSSIVANKEVTEWTQKYEIHRQMAKVYTSLSDVKDWFANGLDEVASAKAAFIDVWSSGRFYLDEGDPPKLILQSQTETFHAASLAQFIQHLSLIQNECVEIDSDVHAFVSQYQMLKNAYESIREMNEMGFYKFPLESFYCSCGEQSLEEATHISEAVKKIASEFREWLTVTRRSYRAALLFSVSELREIYDLCWCESDQVLLVAAAVNRLQHLCQDRITSEVIRELLGQQSASHDERDCWLLCISDFLKNLLSVCRPTPTRSSRSQPSSKIEIHTLNCGQGSRSASEMHLLIKLYKDRLPCIHEIFRCTEKSSPDELNTFVERVRAFPDSVFVILQVDRLTSRTREVLVSFLSDRNISHFQIQLHVFQFGDFVHGSPWVNERVHDCAVLGAQLRAAGLKDLINRYVSECVVVFAPAPGMGKTLHIQRKMEELERIDASFQTLVVTIHEKSDICSLVRYMSHLSGAPRVALHFSLSFVPENGKAKDLRFIEELNFFFFSLLVMRQVGCTSCGKSLSLYEEGDWRIFLEIPAMQHPHDWVRDNLPIFFLASVADSPRETLEIDAKTRRVCTYLRAYKDGTINRQYDSNAKKQIQFILDCSGSMNGQPFHDACLNAASLFDSHVADGDDVGVILFDHKVHTCVVMQTVETENRALLRRNILNLPFHSGGTSMFSALNQMLNALEHDRRDMDTWVVTLTDGCSDKVAYEEFRRRIQVSHASTHIIVVGVNLDPRYEAEMVQLCRKYGPDNADTKGFFVRSDNTTAGINEAFSVVKSKIPVSQTFEFDGPMTDEDCQNLIRGFLPQSVRFDDKILVSFWILFLYRRVHVFDQNESFNYNETNESLGSSLMTVMLDEVERLLSAHFRQEWSVDNHAQIIYDFSPSSPEFRLVCTAPEQLDRGLRSSLQCLDLPGFHIPTKAEISKRSTLDRLLSQAFKLPLQDVSGSKVLRCIDDAHFVLTLDFFMKLLGMHERIECGLPCILEGETGVSKTALTKMYAILRNASLTQELHECITADLEEVLCSLGIATSSIVESSPRERLEELIVEERDQQTIYDLLVQKLAERSPLFVPVETDNLTSHELLEQFCAANLVKTFFEIKVDSSLGEQFFVDIFEEVAETSALLQETDATIVVFLDEINTSSIMGLLKEIVIDRRLHGKLLRDNVVIVGASNPSRKSVQEVSRERDLGRVWASGHYQVSELPPSLSRLKWSFESLTHRQEKDFIHQRIGMMTNGECPSFLQASLTEVVASAHEMLRKFARQNIVECIRANAQPDLVDEDLDARVLSVVSLRDIQRLFGMFEFFRTFLKLVRLPRGGLSFDDARSAMLLAVAVVYYLRLDDTSRALMSSTIANLPTEAGSDFHMEDVLNAAIDEIFKETEIPEGIAPTKGLKENIFAALVCSLSQTPLTLAINILADNATGSDSMSKFYRKFPRLSFFHYQCSKRSTSKEIASVFEQAIKRQERVDHANHRCVVFMDEAGLPDEERESLKVLHYLLEGHMSKKSSVGFIAISNHLLDAAKSNRCVMLLRQEPDDEEMATIASGVLFGRRSFNSSVKEIDIEKTIISSDAFVSNICRAYLSIQALETPHVSYNTWFGLRDFVYFLSELKARSSFNGIRLTMTMRDYIYSMERNFGGIPTPEMSKITTILLAAISNANTESARATSLFRSPMTIIEDALSNEDTDRNGSVGRARYKLVIDCTDDASILRLLRLGKVAEISMRSLHMLSECTENVELERLRLISRVKFAAMQGLFVILSQTDPVNESFYDLMNQRFREVDGADGSKSLFTNIAVGGISRRSLVHQEFRCVVHILESEAGSIPAPFLNRFEKYRLSLPDIFLGGWGQHGRMLAIARQAKDQVANIVRVFSDHNGRFSWATRPDTLESIFVGLLPYADERLWSASTTDYFRLQEGEGYEEAVAKFLAEKSSLDYQQAKSHVIACLEESFSASQLCILENLRKGRHTTHILQSCFQILSGGCGQSSIDKEIMEIVSVTVSVLQMALTRHATMKLLQVATPELIFHYRLSLPPAVVQKYFDMEHFSFERLLQNHRSKYMVVHTRSEGKIDSDQFYRNSLKSNTLYLDRLRSEDAIRKAIVGWLEDSSINTAIFVVDMSKLTAKKQVNFVRSVVEQSFEDFGQADLSDKAFTLVLHYSPSASVESRCYPALFLAGWEHWFLDNVGEADTLQSVESFLSSVCTGADVEFDTKHIVSRTLPGLVSLDILYKEQTLRAASVSQKRNYLQRLLHCQLEGGITVEDILCQRFVVQWRGSLLKQTTTNASNALLAGTTQLSMSVSIQTSLLQDLQSYLGYMLLQTNQWRNFDALLTACDDSDLEVVSLFCLILKSIPIPPLAEIRLRRLRGACLQPIPCCFSETTLFPFFSFVAEFLDEHLESCRGLLTQGEGEEGHTFDWSDSSNVLNSTQKLLLEPSVDKTENEVEERRKLVACVVRRVARTPKDCLFRRYMQQFLVWKMKLDQPDPPAFIVNWWVGELEEVAAEQSILALHVIAKCQSMQVLRMASCDKITKVGSAKSSLVSMSRCFVDPADVQMLRRSCEEQYLGRAVDESTDNSLGTLLEANNTQIKLLDDALSFFLSPVWIRTTESFVAQDLVLLCRLINEIPSAPTDRHVAMLRYATSGTETVLSLAQVSEERLEVVTNLLELEDGSRSPIFDSDRRCRLVHYIPHWLRAQEHTSNETGSSLQHPTPPFFIQYRNSYRGHLADALFSVVLTLVVRQSNGTDSTMQFLGLQREIESEMNMTPDQWNRSARERRLIGTASSWKGSRLVPIVIAARLVMLTATVAREITENGSCSILESPYSSDALLFWNALMSQPSALWQHLFFSVMLQHGEGSLIAALKQQNGLLAQGCWSQPWKDGIPLDSDNAAIERLKDAERELAETREAEERNGAELHLCPGCRCPFQVAERNCGQFTCGSDAHLIGGRRQLGNNPIGNDHGCGVVFRVEEAPRYQPNRELLHRLEENVANWRERTNVGSVLWKEARDFPLQPILGVYQIFKCPLPSLNILSFEDETASPSTSLLRCFQERCCLTRKSLPLLPDLVEFYLWVHETFRYLVTSEFSYDTRLREVFQTRKLQRRFDREKVHYIESLWDRAQRAVQDFLNLFENSVSWDCETLDVPFVNLADAKMIEILSEGEHVTDGNDWLFMMIHQVIGLQNNYARQWRAISKTGNDIDLDPTSLVKGFGGMHELEAVAPLSVHEVEWVAVSGWDRDTNSMNTEQLELFLSYAIDVELTPPFISNPVINLRRRFAFRRIPAAATNQLPGRNSIQTVRSWYFANNQDADLVEEAVHFLEGRDNTSDRAAMNLHQVFSLQFSTLDYNSTREIVRGCHNLMFGSGKTTSSSLENVGFPSLNASQTGLVESLSEEHMIELLLFASYRLASEGYLFSRLPAYMFDQLSPPTRTQLTEVSRTLTSSQIEEFSRDVLGFYEDQIAGAAARNADESLRQFLVENNFCDADSDPVFARLPTEIKLRHYVALRQQLHQDKLLLMMHSSEEPLVPPKTGTTDTANSHYQGEGSWLLNPQLAVELGHGDSWADDSIGARGQDTALWFESSDCEIVEDPNETKADSTDTLEFVARQSQEASVPGYPGGSDIDQTPTKIQANLKLERTLDKTDQQAGAAKILQAWWRRTVQADGTQVAEHVKVRAITSRVEAAKVLQAWWRRELLSIAIDDQSDVQSRDSSEQFLQVHSPEDEDNNHPEETCFSSFIEHEDQPPPVVTRSESSSPPNIYGSATCVQAMRDWIVSHNIHPSTADCLVEGGVRSIADAKLLFEEFPEDMDDMDIPILDRRKLQRALASLDKGGGDTKGVSEPFSL